MIIDDFVTPAELTGFVREVPSPANWVLNQFLPDRTVRDIEAVIDQVTRTNRAAKFRSYDAETPIGKRDTATRSRITLPPVGQKTVLGEYERLMLERLRTGGPGTDAIVDTIFDDAELNARAVHARVELARGDALVDGRVTINENGLVGLEADYGVDGSHLVSSDWSDPEIAPVLSDLRDWADTYTDDAGEPPGAILTTRRVVSLMLQAEEIRQLAGSLAGVPSIVTRAQLNTVLEAHGLPPVREYDVRIDVDGSSTRPIPEGQLIMTPSDPRSLGETVWGITAEALELAGSANPSLDFEEAPGLVGVVLKEGDPVRTWTKVTGVCLPVIYDPRKLLSATITVDAGS